MVVVMRTPYGWRADVLARLSVARRSMLFTGSGHRPLRPGAIELRGMNVDELRDGARSERGHWHRLARQATELSLRADRRELADCGAAEPRGLRWSRHD